MAKSCIVKYKKKGGKYLAYIPKRGYVLEFSSYNALRKAVLSKCRLKYIKSR